MYSGANIYEDSGAPEGYSGLKEAAKNFRKDYDTKGKLLKVAITLCVISTVLSVINIIKRKNK